MMLVVTGVGSLIHIYATAYMHDDVRFNEDPGRYTRFFVYFNLFIASMLILVTGNNYLMLFELVTLLGFLIALGAVGTRFVFNSPVIVLFAVVIVVGLLLPLLLHMRPTLIGSARTSGALAAVLVLVGGFVLRWAVLATPQGLGL